MVVIYLGQVECKPDHCASGVICLSLSPIFFVCFARHVSLSPGVAKAIVFQPFFGNLQVHISLAVLITVPGLAFNLLCLLEEA
jgi:hypothetical protein